MNDSKGSVVIGHQRSLDRLAGAVVMPDRGGQGQDALHDTYPDPGRGVATVLFEVELTLEGVVDRLVTCLNGLKNSVPGRSASPLRTGHRRSQPGLRQFGLELAPVVVLVSSSCQ
jgi:hypothetical protein